jgi:hypothetical protein
MVAAAMAVERFGDSFEMLYEVSKKPSFEPPHKKKNKHGGKSMGSIRVYLGSRLKRENGTKSDFYVDSVGNVFDDGLESGIRKVGRMSAEGKLTVKAKYRAKHGARLKQIASEPDPKLKGKFKGNCNRRACQHEGAIYFNYGTEAYYCVHCAVELNKANKAEAMDLFGHDLCLLGEPPHGSESEEESTIEA